MYEQGSRIAVPSFGDAQKLDLAAGGMLAWHKAEISGKFPTVFEIGRHPGYAEGWLPATDQKGRRASPTWPKNQAAKPSLYARSVKSPQEGGCGKPLPRLATVHLR